MAPHMPTDPKNAATMILTDYEFWADYRDDIDAKWSLESWLTLFLSVRGQKFLPSYVQI